MLFLLISHDPEGDRARHGDFWFFEIRPGIFGHREILEYFIFGKLQVEIGTWEV